MSEEKLQLEQLPEDPTYFRHEVPIMRRWKDNKIYEKIREVKRLMALFRQFDGPPFVSGALHLGHELVSCIKDAIQKYKHMTNHSCLNRMGYDCHGVPLESLAYKLLNISSHKEVNEMGIANYNKFCKEIVNKTIGSWGPVFDRIARFNDPSDTYRTMDSDFMESVWWIFKRLWDMGLVYKGFEVMPYSVKCGTPFSNFEASNSYKVIETESIYVRFPLVSDPLTSFVAWTTTPWTLPSNVALCVNPEATYVKLTDDKGYGYIVAENLVKETKIKHSKVEKFGLGKDLVGMEYVPPFSYMKREKYQVIAGNFVLCEIKKSTKKESADEDTDDANDDTHIGTGIVHIAPGFGSDDLKVCLENKIIDISEIDKVCPVDKDGKYTDQVVDYKGMCVLDVDKKIIEELKGRHLVLRVYKYKHNYPHCYRSETPLIYKAVPCFFVKVTALRDKLLANNAKVTWIPGFVGSGRFKKWLENVKDWCVSRMRYFGTPINIWATEDESEMECIGSRQELLERAREVPENKIDSLTDIHREFVDDIKILSKSGKIMRRTEFIFDCWFESGAVPMAQYHYPFENKDKFPEDQEYLCDFIAEGLDQTRGWFYTLMVLSTALFNKPAFKTVVCTGLILDENGVKFSKKLGNFKDPMVLLDKYGSDVLRLYLLSSPCVRAEPLLFNESEIDKVKHKLIPYINSVKFFLEHAMNYIKKGNEFDLMCYQDSKHVTDLWVISRVSTMLDVVRNKFDHYQIDSIVKFCLEFIEDLTNWYVKFNRDRLKGLVGLDDWRTSLSTLFKVQLTYCQMMAPFTPYLSEHIYQHLKVLLPEYEESVHLCTYPLSSELKKYPDVEVKFVRLQQVARCVRKLRSMSVKFSSVKIPIKTVTIIHPSLEFIDDIKNLEEFVAEELNCLNFEYKKAEDFLQFVVVPNNKSLGKKYKSLATHLKTQLTKLPNSTLRSFVNKEIDSVQILHEGSILELTRDDFDVIPEVKESSLHGGTLLTVTDEQLTVTIDTTYDAETHNLYQIRRFIIHVQNMRKSSLLRPWDKINIYVLTDNESVTKMLTLYKDRIYDRLKSNVLVIESESQITKVHYEKNFDWQVMNLSSDLEPDSAIFMPVYIEKIMEPSIISCE
jgi:isoleucyl-tRNA synthetase